MQSATTEELFRAHSTKFKQDWAQYPAVVAYYEQEWERCAKHWAAWGRQDVADLASNTNNLVERFHFTLKYSFGRGRVLTRMEDLINLLVYDVSLHYMLDRGRKVNTAFFLFFLSPLLLPRGAPKYGRLRAP
jgi:hypothetical protein